MAVQINLLTVVFILCVINLISALFFGIHLQVTRSKMQVRYFIVSKLLQGLSWLFRLLYYTQPDSLGTLVADLLLVAGFASESILFVQYLGKLSKRKKWFYVISLGIASISIFVLWPFHTPLKNLISLVGYITYMSMIAWPLLLKQNATIFQRVLGFCYACLPLISVSLYVAITAEVTELGYVTSLAGILYYIVILFMQMVGSIGYLLMVKEIDELKLYELATKDYLTGILNRKAFYDYAEVHFHESVIQHKPISFAIIDIDHFKKVNDTYGHQTGDEVLKRLTSSLTLAIRKNDILARFGGEEFVLCFPGVNANEAQLILERLQNRLQSDLTHTDPPLPTCTLSIGLTSGNPQLGDTIDTYLNYSDKALYYCKNNGRSCIAKIDISDNLTIQRIWP